MRTPAHRWKIRAGHPSRFLLFLLVPVLAAGCAGHRLAGSPPGGREPLVLAEVLASDATLAGEVVLADDLIIPEGVTLTLTPGTTVIVEPSDGTRTDPQFLSTGTEVVVRGALNVPKGPVTFRPRGAAGRGAWGGIALTGPSAEANLEGAVVQGAEFGLIALAGSARVGNSTFDGCEVGLAASRQAEVATESNTFTGNGAAAMALLGARVPSGPGDTFQGNDDDVIAQDGSGQDIITTGFVPDTPPPGPVTREYLGEMAMTEDTTWSGTVVVEGQLAVMPEVTLTIEPGTRVLFRFRDTNGDGLGESWIICQGRLRVLGEEDAWVLFDAEEDGAGPGSWDSLSIIASEAPDNLIRYAVFRRGTKALHTHFSRLEAHHLDFEENLRGVQFQESESTTLDRVHLRGNLSAMRFRDSTVRLSNILAEENAAGLNFLRA
ncbi:MAG: hypothetical protein JSV00_00620, partial [bacterium]